ncbi:polysaccharide deacetylase family protein [Aestuariivivens marinum]|uniref:polysaccharide deacetylase family protein n=1 Tax=Aestuariivivens marinum TaxID=2913555 RepID=UPI001F55C8B1|nr:polysaccharide deacetylase family protein [Aestuariivivens marinum]
MAGKFVISLDYELMWGVRDKRTIESYGVNIENVPKVIDHLLFYFKKYNVKGTFAIVGFLFARTKQELKKYFPEIRPNYVDHNLSPYLGYIDSLSEENFRIYHSAIDCINKIKRCKEHEICTHTFSHYYCLEKGQNKASFEADIKSALKIAEKEGINIKSIVFPRNQDNSDYSQILLKNNISVFRGNEKSWFYSSVNEDDETLVRRIMRLIDTYINISGHHCYSNLELRNNGINNLPSSRFLRPYNPSLKMFETLRLRRIKRSMTYAAKNGLIYHLWWHPHNYGSHLQQNFSFLNKILEHYEKLNKDYNFKSCTMSSAVGI